MQGQQVDAALGAVVEPRPQPLDELRHVAHTVLEFLRERAEPLQIGLPRLLPVADLVGHLFHHPELARDMRDLRSDRRRRGVPQRLQQLASRVP